MLSGIEDRAARPAVLKKDQAMRNPWMKLTMDTWALGIEASSVIGLRTLKMAAGGPAAQTEAALMINE